MYDLKLYTTSRAPGKVVEKAKGVVYGCAAATAQQLDKLQWAASDVRRQALEDLCKDALATGANAVTGLRFTSALGSEGLVMEAYGTAVVVADAAHDLDLD